MRIYLAGPMRGLPEFNFPAFDRAAAMLRSLGHEVFNPAERDRETGFDVKGMNGNEDLAAEGFSLREALAADTAYISHHAEAVALLPGWEKSSGVAAEIALAHALGLPVGELMDFTAHGPIRILVSPHGSSGTITKEESCRSRQPATLSANANSKTAPATHATHASVTAAILNRGSAPRLDPVSTGTGTSEHSPNRSVIGGESDAASDTPKSRDGSSPRSSSRSTGSPSTSMINSLSSRAESAESAERTPNLSGGSPSTTTIPPAPSADSSATPAIQGSGTSKTLLNGSGQPFDTSQEISVSSSGGLKQVKPERYDLIPIGALAKVAQLYGRGAAKYAAHNWRRGYEWSKSYAALQRHATQFWNGEDNDPEMDLPHMASVAFHALALLTFMEEQRDFDDRYQAGTLEVKA